MSTLKNPSSDEPRSEVRVGEAELQGEGQREAIVAPRVAL